MRREASHVEFDSLLAQFDAAGGVLDYVVVKRQDDGPLGVFDAPEPWGPWTTVEYWTPDDRFGETREGSDLDWDFNVFFLAFSPKWLGADGRDVTLTFTGGGRGRNNDSFNTVRGRLVVRSGE